jgi:hypothetical protein
MSWLRRTPWYQLVLISIGVVSVIYIFVRGFVTDRETAADHVVLELGITALIVSVIINLLRMRSRRYRR